MASSSGPVVTDTHATFAVADPGHRLLGVRLVTDLALPPERTAFTRRRGGWVLRLDRPRVHRLEYRFALDLGTGEPETVVDATNPRRAPGAFGEKSVVEFPGYRAPSWSDGPAPAGRQEPFRVRSVALGAHVRGTLWSPPDLADDAPAPMLLIHDGPELAGFGGLLRWAGAVVADGAAPAFRVALLPPGDRLRWYAALPAYARALTGEVVPALSAAAPTTRRVLLGASLGALAALHAHRHRPGTFDALFLQSGSFFTRELDPQESGFARFGPVTRFVRELHTAVADAAPVPTVVTCGEPEENFANNEATTAALRRLGYPVRFVPVPDLHNVTAWRDAWHPHLTTLLQEATDAP